MLTVVRVGIFLLKPWIFVPLMSACFLILLRCAYSIFMMPKWEAARFPEPADLKVGQYRVVMLPRCLFFWFRNVKRLEMTDCDLRLTTAPLPGNTATQSGQFKVGHNVAYGRFRWAKFTIWCLDLALCLNYQLSRFPFSMIRDLVRDLGDGVFLGRFMLKIRGRYLFVFWFLLIEMETEEADDNCP